MVIYLAKFKKKISKATPGPNDLKKESPSTEASDNVPATENSNVEPHEPVGGPSISQAQHSEKDRKLNRLFWLRIALAVIVGGSAAFIFEDIEGEDRRWASIGLMIVVFGGTIIVAKSMNMQLPPSDRKKIITQGIGSYVFLYLFSWIMVYTLVNVERISDVINI